MNTDKELQAVAEELTGPAYVTVFYSEPSWILPNGQVKGWKVIIEYKQQLSWVLCYHKELITSGMHEVELGRNSRYERTIKPWKGRDNGSV